MTLIVTLLTLLAFGIIAVGFYLDRYPLSAARTQRLFVPTLGVTIVVFLGAQIALVFLGASDVMAAVDAAAAGTDAGSISTGMGLAIIGVGVPTAFSTLAAGIAVGPIGAASLAAVVEKPEMFGRTLVYLGLAEGIAIYGLVLSILLLDKL